jgi:hypothetical protein
MTENLKTADANPEQKNEEQMTTQTETVQPALPQQLPAVAAEPPVPTDADLDALAAAGNDLTAGDFVGTPLKYAKGKWTKPVVKGEEKVVVEIGATETFTVDPRSYACGWVRWWDKKPTVKIGPGRPIDGFISPVRSRLPDLNKNDWPWRKDKREDPWQETHQVTMKATDTGELLTWVTPTWGGRKAIGNFLKDYTAKAKQHPGHYPVVTLCSRTKPHPDYGTVDEPILQIVDWQPFGEGAAPAGRRLPQPALPAVQELLPPPSKQTKMIGDMDDEIPF